MYNCVVLSCIYMYIVAYCRYCHVEGTIFTYVCQCTTMHYNSETCLL